MNTKVRSIRNIEYSYALSSQQQSNRANDDFYLRSLSQLHCRLHLCEKNSANSPLSMEYLITAFKETHTHTHMQMYNCFIYTLNCIYLVCVCVCIYICSYVCRGAIHKMMNDASSNIHTHTHTQGMPCDSHS